MYLHKLVNICGQSGSTLTYDVGRVPIAKLHFGFCTYKTSSDFTADGNHLYYVSPKTCLLIMDLNGGVAQRLI